MKRILIVLMALMPMMVLALNKQKVILSCDLHCQGCCDKIMKNIAFEKGVKDLVCDLKGKTVTVTYDADKTDVPTLLKAFEKIGKPAKVLLCAAMMMPMNAKTLVAYFSATGTTKAAAEKLAKQHDARLWEIEPAEKYTAADLDWRNSNSRSSLEMNDPEERPMIKRCTDVTPYDTVYVGFPIWWGICPRIINSWLDNNEPQLQGKIMIPFATSGSSGIEEAEAYLRKTYPSLNWKKGMLLNQRK